MKKKIQSCDGWSFFSFLIFIISLKKKKKKDTTNNNFIFMERGKADKLIFFTQQFNFIS